MGLLVSVLDAFFLSSPHEGKGALLRWTPEADPAGGQREPVPGDSPLEATEVGLQLRVGAPSMKSLGDGGEPVQETRRAQGSGQCAGGAGSLCPEVK